MQSARLVARQLDNAISAVAVASYWPARWGHPSHVNKFSMGRCACARNTLAARPSCLCTCSRRCVSAETTAGCCLTATFLPSEPLLPLHSVFCVVFRKRGSLSCERLLLTQVLGCNEKNNNPKSSLQLSLPAGFLCLRPCCVSSDLLRQWINIVELRKALNINGVYHWKQQQIPSSFNGQLFSKAKWQPPSVTYSATVQINTLSAPQQTSTTTGQATLQAGP